MFYAEVQNSRGLFHCSKCGQETKVKVVDVVSKTQGSNNDKDA